MDTPTTPVPTPARIKPPKPEKPFPGFPLFWHVRGYWCVKRQGKQIPYMADWKESYDQFLKDEEARDKGDPNRSIGAGRHTLKDAIEIFLSRQFQRFDDGEISAVQLAKYRRELVGTKDKPSRLEMAVNPSDVRLVNLIGAQAPEIFIRIRSAAMKRGLSACERHVICVRAMLDHAHRAMRLPAPNYADCFDKPGSGQLRKARHAKAVKHGERAWTVDELRKIVKAAAGKSLLLYAGILLGLNVGYQAADISALPEAEIDHEHQLLKFPRVKNGMRRISPLWPETYAAVAAVLKQRPQPASPEYKGLVFLLANGVPPTRNKIKRDSLGRVAGVVRIDSLNLAYKRMVKKLNLKRHGAGFNTLRAMFRTLCTGASADPDLVAVITGRRTSRPVDEFYLRGDMRAKLFDVVNHVKTQIWPKGKIPPFKKQKRNSSQEKTSDGAALDAAAPPTKSKPARKRAGK